MIFALDIGKESITYRACRPGKATKAFVVGQDIKGFNKIVAAMEEYKKAGYDVWVGYEPTGPYSSCIFEFLVEGGWRVVQINPRHTSRFNDIMSNSPGKSDPRDPLGISGLIWQGCYRIPLHLTGTYAELRVACSEWAMLSKESTRLRNQLHSMLAMWWPELGTVFKNTLCKSARGVIRKYSSTDVVARAGLRSLRLVLAKASNGKTTNRAQAVMDAARESVSLRSSEKARHRSIVRLLDRLELVEGHKELIRTDMTEMLSKLPESRLLLSVKGIGVIVTSTILGECGNIGEYHPKQLEKLVGLNLCEFSSGKHKGKRKISKCGRAGVRYALCLAATRMTGEGCIYHDLAEEMKARGKEFGEIRIAVARKLVKLLCALMHTGENFDMQRFARRRTADDLPAHQDGQPLMAA